MHLRLSYLILLTALTAVFASCGRVQPAYNTAPNTASNTAMRAIESADRMEKMAGVYYSQGEHDRAVNELLEAIRLDEEQGHPKASRWVQLAYNYRQMRKYDFAKECAETALEMDPKNADAHSILGAIAKSMGDPEAELSHLLESVKLDPNDTSGIVLLANAYRERNIIGLARERYEEALRIAPGDIFATYNYGLFEKGRGDWPAAVALFEKVAASTPQDSNDEENIQHAKWLIKELK